MIPPMSSKKRRKSSSKNNSNDKDICEKQCATRYSPSKDNEDNEKTGVKSKRGIKLTLKPEEQRKTLKRINTIDHAITNKRMRISQCKNKREKKTEDSDILLAHNKYDVEQEKTNKCTKVETSDYMKLSIQENHLLSSERTEQNVSVVNKNTNDNLGKYYISITKVVNFKDGA